MSEKNWTVDLFPGALRFLKKTTQKKAGKYLTLFAEWENLSNPLAIGDVRSLVGRLKGYYRLRIGEDRVIFELDRPNRKIGVLVIVPRKDAY